MQVRRPEIVLSLLAFAVLSCTSPKSADMPIRPAGVGVPARAEQGDASVSLGLRDGSRIIGTPLLTDLALASSHGSIVFRLEQVSSIVFSDSAHEVSVEFRNGDVLHGSLQLDSLPVQCAAGRINLPVSAILTLSPFSSERDLAEGLVAHYPLRGNTADVTGRGHDAVNHGAVPAPDRFGSQGRAFEFDGTEAHINLPGGIIDPGGAACTLSLWVLAKPSRVSRMALYIGAATGELSISAADGEFRFGADLANHEWHSVSVPAEENKFVHLAAVYIRGNSIRLYLNGERKSESPLPDIPLLSGLMEYSSGIGAYAPEHPEQGRRLGVSNWRGRISDVRIYNRALSDAEIMSLARLRG